MPKLGRSLSVRPLQVGNPGKHMLPVEKCSRAVREAENEQQQYEHGLRRRQRGKDERRDELEPMGALQEEVSGHEVLGQDHLSIHLGQGGASTIVLLVDLIEPRQEGMRMKKAGLPRDHGERDENEEKDDARDRS